MRVLRLTATVTFPHRSVDRLMSHTMEDSDVRAALLAIVFMLAFVIDSYFFLSVSISLSHTCTKQDTVTHLPLFTAWRTIFENLIDVASSESGLSSLNWIMAALAFGEEHDCSE